VNLCKSFFESQDRKAFVYDEHAARTDHNRLSPKQLHEIVNMSLQYRG